MGDHVAVDVERGGLLGRHLAWSAQRVEDRGTSVESEREWFDTPMRFRRLLGRRTLTGLSEGYVSDGTGQARGREGPFRDASGTEDDGVGVVVAVSNCNEGPNQTEGDCFPKKRRVKRDC